jgi:putative salt-induced outer membrane protein YdiY
MKLLKTVPAAALLAGLFASAHALADDSVFTVMDDPSTAKNLSKVRLTPVIWRSPEIRKVLQ